MASAPSILGSSEIRRDGIKPGCEFAAAEAISMPVNAHESLLGKVVRVLLIAQHPKKKLIDRTGVALHQRIQGGIMPGSQPLHIQTVLVGRVNGLHARGQRLTFPASNFRNSDDIPA